MTTATSASDRYEGARAALAAHDANEAWYQELSDDEKDGKNYEYFEDEKVATADRLASALRTLIEPPATSETVPQIATRIFWATNSTTRGYEVTFMRADMFDMVERAVHAGIQAGWNDWEPENAPGIVDTRETEVVDIVFDRLPDHEGANFIEVENQAGVSIKLGKWVTRPDGYAVIRVEVVR